jgi:hypothetical protein
MASERFHRLKERLDILAEYLLPKEISIDGLYENEEEIFVRSLAYRVLSHAEVESYLEERAEEIAQEALREWQRSRHVSRVTLCLVGFSGGEMKRPAESLQAPNEKKAKQWPELIDVGEKLRNCVLRYVRYLRTENHGVKERDILSIVLPVGLMPIELDPNFLVEVNNFGQSRGLAAHSSTMTPHVRQGVNPGQEREQVVRVLVYLESIDRRFDELLSEARAKTET